MNTDFQNIFKYFIDILNLDLVKMQDFVTKYSDVSAIANLSISLFCAVLLLGYVKTETGKYGRSWTKRLGYFYLLFFLQYLLISLKVPRNLEVLFPFLQNQSGIIFAELLGFCINLCLLFATNIIRNEQKLLSKWFVILVGLDILAVFSAIIFRLNTNLSGDVAPTLCRFIGDFLTFVGISYFGYTAYKNIKYFNQKYWRGVELLFLIFVIFYAILHLLSPFIPNVAHQIASLLHWEGKLDDKIELVIQYLGLVLTLTAMPLKGFLFIFASRISSLENGTLIKLRKRLRESVDKRVMFFSRDGIMKTIHQIFRVKSVRFFVKVPALAENNSIVNKLQRFEYPAKEGAKTNDYDLINIDENFTNLLEGNKSDELESNGIKAIKHYGAQIGYLQLEKNEKQKFTFSPLRMIDILSYDISPLIQSYRLQESLILLVNRLKVVREENALITATKLKSRKFFNSEIVSNRDLLGKDDLKDALIKEIQQILSPESAEITTNFMFVQEHEGEGHLTEGVKKTYDCWVNNGDIGFSIQNNNDVVKKYKSGEIILNYKPEKDSIERPSFGYFNTYGETISGLVNQTYLDCVGEKLDLVIRQLSSELTKRHNYKSWIETIDKYAKFALIDDVVVLHPDKRNYLKSSVNVTEIIEKVLESEFSNPKTILPQLNANHIFKVIKQTDEHLILGTRLDIKQQQSFILFAVNAEFLPKTVENKEIRFNKKWENFFINFADIAEKSLIRMVQAYNIEKNQQELSDFDTSLKIGLFAHEMLNILEDSNDPIFSLKEEIEELKITLVEKAKLEKLTDRFLNKLEDLQSLGSGIRSVNNIKVNNIRDDRDDKGPASLNEAVKNVFDNYRKSYDDSLEKIRFTNKVNDNIKINLSLTYLNLIFSNLIKNSIRAINSNKGVKTPEITVWTEDTDSSNKVICYIADTGCGINDNDRREIFNSTFSTKMTGGGLGLFSVKKLLRRYHGEIELLEKPLEGNTTIKITLPKHREGDY